MARKTLDIDADLQALLAKAEKMKTAQKLRLGELVLETGAEKLMDADMLQDLLRWGIAQMKTHPEIVETWRRGGAGFPDKAGANGNDNAHGRATASVASRHRAPDLLASTAAE